MPNLELVPSSTAEPSADVAKAIADYSPLQLRALARKLSKHKGGSAGSDVIPRRSGQVNTFPLSFAQERLWFLDQLMPGSPAYNWPFAFRFRMALDASVWERALDELVARHEILRTAYSVIDGLPVQRVSPALHLTLEVIDLTQLPSNERETQAQLLIQRDARQGFDLATGPLFRFKLIRLADNEYIYFGTMHHSVVDAWSRKVVIEELSQLIKSLSTGKPLQLSELPIQYGDYAAWERQRMQGEFKDRLIEYWKGCLQGLQILELPIDHPRPMVQTLKGTSTSLLIRESLADALRALGQSQGATLHMTLLAAFTVLLMRHSGQDDIAVAVPIANRNSVDVERLIGFFVNTLVIRTNLSGNPSFLELLRRVREVALGAYAHQDLPFEKLVEEIQPKRDLSRNPLAQVTFQLEDIPTAAGDARPGPRSESTVAPIEVDAGVAVFDLDLHLFADWDSHLLERPKGIRGTLTYNTDLFEAGTIERMLGHLQRLLESVVRDAEQRIWELPLMTAEEREEQEQWNRTEVAYPGEKTVAELFEEQAAATPEAVALVWEEERLSYGELNGRGNQLAHYLRGLGVGPEVRVGIGMERSVEMVVGLLGILKAGGAYVPLDPGYPRERLRYMLGDAGVKVLLTQAKLGEEMPETEAPVVYVDREWDEISRNSRENLGVRADAENLAYVIYTSGSTGQPKGVAVPNAAVINLVNSIKHSVGLTADDILLSVTSLSFDIAALELYLPLLSGAKLVISTRSDTVDPARLVSLLTTSKATIMQATPATWQSLVVAGWQGDPELTILCGGEALPHALANQLRCRGFAVWNLYGPTETTIWSALWPLNEATASVLIGRPIANTSLHIVDLHMRRVPIGVEGELCIGGSGVSRGYLNRPELTAENFVPDPFGRVAGARMYRTGDRVRRCGDGNIEFLGRIDEQVKIRGYRVEPGEIEGLLAQHPAIEQAVVILREDEPGEKRLVGYVVMKGEGGPTGSELRNYIKERLPDYMVPSGFVQMPALSLTPNRKVDRRHLPKPEDTGSDPRSNVIAPRDVYELRLEQLWKEILNVRSIGMKDNFFDVGGHSLLAVRLVSRIAVLFHRTLPLAATFHYPTIEQLAGVLRKGAPTGDQSPLVVIQPLGKRTPVFLVHPAGGSVMCYYELARQLGVDRPVYGLQDPTFDDRSAPSSSIEEMAKLYLDAIRTTQPKGPYILGGWSTGGPVAFEMATQLTSAGERVGAILLLDTPAPYAPYKNEDDREQATAQALALLSKKLALYTGVQFSDVQISAREFSRAEAESYFLEELKKRSFLPPDTDGSFLSNFLHTSENNMRATWTYHPQLYAGSIFLFRGADLIFDVPDEERRLYSEQALGWQRFSQQAVHVDSVPGNHMTMMTLPYVKSLSEKIAQCLEGIEGS